MSYTDEVAMLRTVETIGINLLPDVLRADHKNH